MVQIKSVQARAVPDSRGEDTIEVTLSTNVGKFSATSPQGKSTGKFEVKTYKKTLEGDVKMLAKMSDYFEGEDYDAFDDLRNIESTLEGQVGGNTILAFEYALLKAMAKEQEKEVWQVINPNLKRDASSTIFPRLVGNTIGGGKHSEALGSAEDNELMQHKPDFQEFVSIPDAKSILTSWNVNKAAKVNAGTILKQVDEKFQKSKNDEDAWMTGLDNKRALDVMADVRTNMKDEQSIHVDIGLDVAATSFYKRRKYHYHNPTFSRNPDEQYDYLVNLIDNFHLFYIEDPFAEEDFSMHAQLLKRFPDRLIVGDDLTVTNSDRLKKAIKQKAISGIIVKPNQCGSLCEVQRVVELCREHDIKMIFSHRSGETRESILADVAFGFQAQFLKSGITSPVREAKIARLLEIEQA